MAIKSRIFDEKVWKIGKNRGFEGFFKGKMGFSGVWGRKSRVFSDFRGEKGGILRDLP